MADVEGYALRTTIRRRWWQVWRPRTRTVVLPVTDTHDRHGIDLGSPQAEADDGTVPVALIPFPPPGGIGWHLVSIPPCPPGDPDEHGIRSFGCGGAALIPIYPDGVKRRIIRPQIIRGHVEYYSWRGGQR